MLRTAIFLECNTCKEKSSAIDGMIYSRSELRGLMREEGWRTQLAGRRHPYTSDTCPDCVAAAAAKAGAA